MKKIGCEPDFLEPLEVESAHAYIQNLPVGG